MSTKEKTAAASLDDCKTLGEVCDFIKSKYDADQVMSNTGKALLKGYLKNAKPAK